MLVGRTRKPRSAHSLLYTGGGRTFYHHLPGPTFAGLKGMMLKTESKLRQTSRCSPPYDERVRKKNATEALPCCTRTLQPRSCLVVLQVCRQAHVGLVALPRNIDQLHIVAFREHLRKPGHKCATASQGESRLQQCEKRCCQDM